MTPLLILINVFPHLYWTEQCQFSVASCTWKAVYFHFPTPTPILKYTTLSSVTLPRGKMRHESCKFKTFHVPNPKVEMLSCRMVPDSLGFLSDNKFRPSPWTNRCCAQSQNDVLLRVKVIYFYDDWTISWVLDHSHLSICYSPCSIYWSPFWYLFIVHSQLSRVLASLTSVQCANLMKTKTLMYLISVVLNNRMAFWWVQRS